MKISLSWLGLALAIVWIAVNSSSPKSAPGEFDLVSFAKIPVLSEGRNKPLDTVARNALLIIHGKEMVRLENGRMLGAMPWLADMLFNSSVADDYPAFVINNPEVLGLFGWAQNQQKYFSFTQLAPYLGKINQEAQQVENLESAKRSPYQTAVFNLRNAMILYQRLKNSLYPNEAKNFSAEIIAYLQEIPGGLVETMKQSKGKPFDQKVFDSFSQDFERYETMSEMAYILPVPQESEGHFSQKDWKSIGFNLLQAISTRKVDPVTKNYALLGDAYHQGDVPLFNQQVDNLRKWMGLHEPRASWRAGFECLFNQLAPFYQAMGLYLIAFLFVCAYWLSGNRELIKTAISLLLLALAVHTFGLVSRMYLQERPPVTNLYSSAIFIGWGTVIIGLILERIFRDGIGAVCASIIGFTTLIIAHHLAGSGDTLEMLQAVLDTNIWLATHVVAITTGYSAMFFAGTLATIYVIRGVFTRSLTKDIAQSLSRMTYGVICFATLFSFVGTVLGGIWADQSWGRFWGWDPKENGALLIVLWCAITLHARWGGYIRERGLMVMALFGNVITSFSWFGVNMLGIGLHSYGFMNKAVPWLGGFMVSQLLLMLLALLPRKYWLSSRPSTRST